jgi:hypothetical protein
VKEETNEGNLERFFFLQKKVRAEDTKEYSKKNGE